MRRVAAACLCLSLSAAFPVARTVAAEPMAVPVLVPLTGFLALEGASQRNGALLALSQAPAGLQVRANVIDTGAAPEGAVNALERALSDGPVPVVAASMLGSQMLAMLPLAKEYGVPLLTVSGTAAVTRQDNPWVFRFFPGDDVTKTAHARYVVQELAAKRPAVIYQTTAYGQSGYKHLTEQFAALGVQPVFAEGVEPAAKDLSPVIAKALAAQPDALVLHLHAAPTALFIRQAAALGAKLPIVAGSAMHQPATAALLEPAELKGVCAETASSPVSADTPAMAAFVQAYRAAFNTEPDAFALGQYDAVKMALAAMAKGAKTPDQVRQALSTERYDGLAMSYRSNGKGDMAHSALIVCYDGETRTPKVAKRYDDVTGVLAAGR
ncbi:MAG TPA: ABC transporter substrate-binding protein [Azospirillaceae bacterium]|nr:ABC transporter substrate-binding protein [Azospirillaceae bacterium]HRQ81678.1 ABC transporter substrate-binding protein [Azospirillaceae bacterium]